MNLILRNVKVMLAPRRYRAELASAEKLLQTAADAATNGVPDRIRSFLRSDSWEVRNSALKLIARTRCEALYPALINRLLDHSEAGIVRRNCAEQFAVIPLNSAEAVQALRLALRDEYWEVRSESARSLSRMCTESPELERELLALLDREENLDVRAAFAQALGAAGASREAFDRLASLAEQGSWPVRYQAAVALVEMGARRPEFAPPAADILRRIDLLAEGSATRSVFQQRILDLAQVADPDHAFPAPDAVKRRYLHLKRGWLKTDGE